MPLFSESGIESCKCSSLLQRRLVDISSHRSFRATVEALEEHYQITVPYSAIVDVTYEIGLKAQEFNAQIQPPEKQQDQLIAQIDGSMIPIVDYSAALTEEQIEQGIKRNRDCHWKEFRLCTVSVLGEDSTHYGVTMGDPLEAGCMMYQSCQQKGLGSHTMVHGVADGAPWIAEQYERQFGDQHEFYLDFYHASEYLAEASKEVDLQEGKSVDWMKKKQAEFKAGMASEVISELKELSHGRSEDSTLRKAHQYFHNREDQLQYDEAINKGLPIGSGEVESGHRSVLQARLKKSGAWWRRENAIRMAQIKVMQANGMKEEFFVTLAS